MKKINQNQGKLQFRKQAIANLTKSETENVQGGKAAFTTSFGNCSGFLCCSPTKSKDILQDWLDTIGGGGNNGGGNNGGGDTQNP